jgi:hypothetical protein
VTWAPSSIKITLTITSGFEGEENGGENERERIKGEGGRE